MPPGARYVGRGTRWGNPALIGVARDGDGRRVGWTVSDPATGRYGRTHHDETAARIEATAHYRAWLERQPQLVTAARRELAGLDLACWCPLPAPGQPDHCHAAVLLDLLAVPAAVRAGGER
jgi:hypothetical protein